MNNEIKINVPEGMEIDKENSTFECIRFKPKWVPKRGEFAAAGSSHSQTILVAEYIEPDSITGFLIKPLALLSKNGLSLYNNDLTLPTLWISEEASASEKELFIEKLNEQGYVYDPNDPRVIYKKEKELPKTWEEFCKNNPTIKPNEYFVSTNSSITRGDLLRHSEERHEDIDGNLLPSIEYAEAMLALCKIIQLRDCYNDGWKANWRDTSQHKYVVKFYDERLINDINFIQHHVLNFKTPKLREKFINNFKDLIEKAKPLL